MTRQGVLARVTSLCVSEPFGWTRAVTPFDFDQQPSGQIDQVFRIQVEAVEALGGLNYSEDRTDLLTVWLARKLQGAPHTAHEALVTDVTSLTSAIVRDGSTGGGDFSVPDGGTVEFQHENGREFAVARLGILINYEVTL